MSRYYKSTMAQPVDFVYNLPYQEMLQGIQAKTAVHEAGLNQLNKMSLAGQDITYLDPDEAEVKNYLSNFDATVSELSQQDLTDPRARQALQKFTTQTARDFSQSGRLGHIMQNKALFKQHIEDIKSDKNLDQNQKIAAINKTLKDFQGTVNPDGTYNTINLQRPSDYVDVTGEWLKIAKDVEADKITRGGSNPAAGYITDWESWEKSTPTERMALAFQGFINSDRVRNYLQDGETFRYLPTGVSNTNIFSIQEVEDSKGNKVPRLSYDHNSYLGRIFDAGVALKGSDSGYTESKKGDTWFATQWKAAQELAKYNGSFVEDAYGNSPQLPEINENVKNIENIINRKEGTEVFTEQGTVQVGSETNWLGYNTGYKNTQNQIKKEAIEKYGKGTRVVFTTYDSSDRMDYKIYKPPTKEDKPINNVPNDYVSIVKSYWDTKGIADSDNLTKPQIDEALTDYKTRLINSGLNSNEVYTIPGAFKKEITEDVFGTETLAGRINVFQDAVFIDGDSQKIININDKSDAAKLLRNARIGADGYQISIDAVDSKGGYGYNTAGALSGTIIKDGKTYKVKIPIKDPKIIEAMEPLNSFAALNSALGTDVPVPVTDKNGNTSYYVSEPAYKNEVIEDGQKQVLNKNIYQVDSKGNKIPVDNSMLFLDLLERQANFVKQTEIPKISKSLIGSVDKPSSR